MFRETARRIAASLAPSVDRERGEAWFDRGAMLSLPKDLQTWAICDLQQAVGEPHGAPRAARELVRQLAADTTAGCDVSPRRCWRAEGDTVRLSAPPERSAERVDFSYTFALPGERALPEAGFRLELSWSPVQPWMRRAWPTRAGLALPLSAGETIEVRNRRPGDRLRPFGWSRSCRLKELLINRHVPKEQRDGLPLLIVNGEIAWVPGVTIGERFRIGEQEHVWLAELHTLPSHPPSSLPTTRKRT